MNPWHECSEPDPRVDVLIEVVAKLEHRLENMNVLEKEMKLLKEEHVELVVTIKSFGDILSEYDEVIVRLHELLKKYISENEGLKKIEK
jgi:hypothetical protein